MRVLGVTVQGVVQLSVVLQLGPNADVKKWEEEQIGIATVSFGAKNAKERSKVHTVLWLVCLLQEP